MMMRSAFLALAAGLAATAGAQTLKVGDSAPALTVEKFVTGTETAKLEHGKPYVIDFWATWCGPCIKTIPHLVETQEKYKGSGLQIIAVSASERGDSTEEKLGKIATFVEGRNDINYTIAYDDDRSMITDWMRPAGRNTIPTAFVVDREGKIAFIGNPGSEQAAFDAAVQKVSAPSGSTEPASQADRPFALMTGDKAPKLAISEWVKGEPITGFEKGQVYVVEFWATWCGPCIAGMPHVTQLQEEYGDKVKIIGVNIWDDPANVDPFMKDRGAQKSGDALMGYRVAIEEKFEEGNIRNGVMAKEWMEAAGRRGIPSAFIVDREGRIAWQGHPMQMDEPLEKIVAGEWDIQAEKEKAAKAAANQSKVQKLQQDYSNAVRAGDTEAALTALDKLIEVDDAWASRKYMTLLQAGRTDQAYTLGREMAAKAQNDPMTLNIIAWYIVDPENRPAEQDLDLALKAAERAVELTKRENASILDTLACVYWDRGEKEKAVEIQTEAVKLAEGTPNQAELEGRLEMFKKELGRN
jgi:thiol-disulfide isomerase/thioredoxin